MTDCRNINQNGPDKFRARADNVLDQFCYFNVKQNDKLYNKFISKGIWQTGYIRFQIDRVLSKNSRSSETTTTLEATSELKDLLEKKYISANRVTIGRNHLDRRGNQSDFKPKKLGTGTKTKSAKSRFLLLY